jgi:hypothetical protein
MKNSINFGAVKHYLNDLVSHWEAIYLMPADVKEEYIQEDEYYQNVKASIIQNDLYEDIQIGFSYLLNNTSLDTSQYMDFFEWNDKQIRELLEVTYSSIFGTNELLKTPDTIELKNIAFKDWWYKTKGK